MRAAALRSQVESTLGVKFPTPRTLQEPPLVERVHSGFRNLDDTLSGGLPRGGLTEFSGPASSGRTGLGLSVLAERTAQEEVCAWVDASDCFDPDSAERTGVVLHRLLWVRCRDFEQAIQAVDLILSSGGFGLVVLDLGSVPARTLHRLPLSFWFRFRQTIEHSRSVLLLLTPEACARSCSSLIVRCRLDEANWSTIPAAVPVSHAYLLQGSHVSAEVIRSRFQQPSEGAAHIYLRTEINYRGACSGEAV